MADQLEAILEQIKKYNKIIIHRHQRPDPDAIGSQIGLAEILKASFPYKQIYVVGKDIPGLDWIGIQNVLAWAIFVEQEDGHFRIRLRSKGPVINELAKHHYGGGHPLASGAKAADHTEISQVIKELDTLVSEYQK